MTVCQNTILTASISQGVLKATFEDPKDAVHLLSLTFLEYSTSLPSVL